MRSEDGRRKTEDGRLRRDERDIGVPRCGLRIAVCRSAEAWDGELETAEVARAVHERGNLNGRFSESVYQAVSADE
jgi:hypothetical protein